MTITKEVLQAVRADMDKALAEIGARHGLTQLKSGKCVYDPRSGNFTIKVEGVAEGGADKDAARYDQIRGLFPGLPERGTEFTYGGEKYAVSGANSTGSKVLAKRNRDGRVYQFPRDAVVKLCKA